MSYRNTRLTTDLDFFRQIQPDALLRWLAPVREFLNRKGFKLPASGGPLDYEHLVELLADPDTGTPASFLESVYIIQGMSTEDGRDDIFGYEDAFGDYLEVADNASPADTAVHAWLRNPEELETLFNRRKIRARRSFTCFSTKQRRLTPFIPPTKVQLDALQERLDAYCLARRWGKGCKVSFMPCESELQFLVRHGLSPRRAASLTNGEPGSVFYRPQWHDVVIYNIEQDELRLNCSDISQLKAYKRIFGSCLFGDANYFPGDAIYTLDPLVRDGRQSLTCVDVPGMENVTLQEIEMSFHKAPARRQNVKSSDIFLLIDQNILTWPIDGQLTKATFEIRFRGSRKARKVTILPSNKLLLTRDADAPIVHDWLHRRSFTSVS